MKKSILFAAAVLFASVGFSQSAESTTKSKENCAKGKPACCAHASKSKCSKSTASTSSASASDATPATATEPKKPAKAEKKESTAL